MRDLFISCFQGDRKAGQEYAFCFGHILGFPGSSAGKESACNSGDPGLVPRLGRSLPTPVFRPGEFHGLYNPRGHKKSETTEPFSLSLSLSWFWHMVILIVHRGITYGIPVSYRQKRTPQAIYHNTNTFWLIGYVLQKGKSFSVLRLQLYVWKPNLNFVLL